MATMRDIARQCDVSIQTVSRILRGHTGAYRGETVQAVLETARVLRYQPPWASVGLGDRLPTLGLIIMGWGGTRTTQRIDCISQQAQQAGYQLQVMSEHFDAKNPDRLRLLKIARSLMAQGAKGVFILRSMPVDVAVRRELAALDIPVVFVDWGPPRWGARVVLDRLEVIEQVADHLAQLGHKQVAFMAATRTTDFLEHKILPFHRSLARRDVTLLTDPNWLLSPFGQDLEQQAYQAAQSLVETRPDITALIAGNDQIALAAIAGVQALGLGVPDDLSVIGYDDLPMARLNRPSLTTVCPPPHRQVGMAAMQMMRQCIESPQQPIRQVVLPSKLIVRESTGPAPSPSLLTAQGSDPPVKA